MLKIYRIYLYIVVGKTKTGIICLFGCEQIVKEDDKIFRPFLTTIGKNALKTRLLIMIVENGNGRYHDG